MPTPRLLYCNCTYAKVVPPAVKQEVLRRLAESGVAFDAVPDLCEMSAAKDRGLARYATEGTRIAACFPRAVRWLFHAAGTPLPENAGDADDAVEVHNMRELTAEEVVDAMLRGLETSATAGDDAGDDRQGGAS